MNVLTHYSSKPDIYGNVYHAVALHNREHATRFTEHESRKFSLPISAGGDAKWVRA